MTPDAVWLQLLVQVPLVGVFVFFVLTIQKAQQAAVERNHNEWRVWLTERDKERAETEKENIAAMEKTERQLAHLTAVTLMIYLALNQKPLPDEVMRLVTHKEN